MDDQKQPIPPSHTIPPRHDRTNVRPLQMMPPVRGERYSPERDIAHIGPGLLMAGLQSMDPRWHEPWFAQFVADHDLRPEDLLNGFRELNKALELIIPAPDAPAALHATGFDKLPYPQQIAVYTRLGQVFLSAIWVGYKDLKTPSSPAPLEVAEIFRLVDEMMLKNKEACECPSGSETSTNSGPTPATTSP